MKRYVGGRWEEVGLLKANVDVILCFITASIIQ